MTHALWLAELKIILLAQEFSFDESASYTLFDVTGHAHGQGRKNESVYCVSPYRDPINIYANHSMIISFDSLLEKQLSVIIGLIRLLHKGTTS